MERKVMREEKGGRAREDSEEPISECIRSVNSVENGHQAIVFSLRILSGLWPAFVLSLTENGLYIFKGYKRKRNTCSIW